MNPWLTRWDRMQERYLVARDERFAIMARLVQATQGDAPLILDLGCGTGSVMAALLEAIPGSRAIGVDMDPTLLRLAEERLAVYGERAHVVFADLRQNDWGQALSDINQPRRHEGREDLSKPSRSSRLRGEIAFHAIVSATALHWLSADQLSALYAKIVTLLLPDGIFLNADHVASDDPRLQRAWEAHRSQTLAENSAATGEDWDAFWTAYLAELGPEATAERQRLLGPWEGVEAGQPLAWHLDRLKQAGFSSVDCFWRLDCDAIYGGIR